MINKNTNQIATAIDKSVPKQNSSIEERTVYEQKINFDSVPQELKECDQWVLWKSEDTGGKKLSKIPYAANDYRASTTNPDTWSSFKTATSKLKQSDDEYSGIGFVFSESDPFIGFDWDNVRDSTTGEFDPEILKEIRSLDSYAEISQSGEGAHVIAKGKVPGSKNRRGVREIYDHSRFFVFTGEHLEGTPIAINEATTNNVLSIYSKIDSSSMDVEVAENYEPRLTDIDIIEKCKNADNRNLFDSLYSGNWQAVGRYGSHSEADLALCNLIAAHTRDPQQIDRLFSGSGLNRDKWSRKDYKEQTIAKALEDVEPAEENPRDKYFEGNRFIVKSLAEQILEENKFFTLADTEVIYHYENGIYIEGGKELIDLIAQRRLGDYSANRHLREVLSYIKRETRVNRESINQDEHIINLNNGLYDLKTNTFKPHSPAVLSTTRIPVDYNPDAECPNIDKFLSEIVSLEDQQVLVEWVGYSLIPDTRMQKAVMVLGNGSNGKSVYLKLLTQFIGKKNTSGESLQNLENNRFSTANLYGKLINVFPDLANIKIYDNSTFKTLCGGDRIRGERKFEGAFEFENTARLIFSANELPPIRNGSFADFRRWILIDFPNTFEGKTADKNLIDKLVTPEELSGFLNKALTALKVLLANEEFSYNKSVEDVKRMYLLNSNSVAVFVDECIELSNEDTSKHLVYEEYKQWCIGNDLEPEKNNIFGKHFKELGYTYSRESTGSREYKWDGITMISK
ncbi:phage/plasmid primase, P4 family [Methanococcoides seepicolus]|uniref:SF3 helicase domain-containing protein n=1 Tax=Methanococcoides seepicolus TaxID=2828780 RepID=A0A9E4ZJ98_9EURY|nr:phage/plasmid primase, P4 family [Methanococcoides seepicolus]MCM1987779.1 hypothetical protein [Methanococcoides seepicolus]